MQNSKASANQYISVLENLIKQDLFHLLFNLAVYLCLGFPLSMKLNLPPVDSPWGNLSNYITIAFALSGFGFIYWASNCYVRLWLINLRITFEYAVNTLLVKFTNHRTEDKSLVALHVRNTALFREAELISYLSRNKNDFLESQYKERLELNERYNLGKKNIVTTLVLLTLHFSCKSDLYLSLSVHLPNYLPFMILIVLLWSSSESFPEDNYYFHIVENPVRNLESKTLEKENNG
jgi:hypothetical protein